MLFVGASDGHLYAFTGNRDLSLVDAPTYPEGRASIFSFYRPSPNPSATSTRLAWVMPERAHVNLKLYDVQGRLVRHLVSETRGPGEHAVMWDGRDQRGKSVAAGVYFARLQAGKASSVRKLVRLRY
jgi:hypothetical protein